MPRPPLDTTGMNAPCSNCGTWGDPENCAACDARWPDDANEKFEPSWCARCSGTGWTEGGRTLKTPCPDCAADEARPAECPDCHGCMDDSGRYPVCPSCRMASETDHAHDMGRDLGWGK